jgi:hypothetical protein
MGGLNREGVATVALGFAALIAAAAGIAPMQALRTK